MENIIKLLSQRRIWAAITGFISLLLMAFGVRYDVDMENLTDIFQNIGIAVANLLTILLPIWSYFLPKKQ